MKYLSTLVVSLFIVCWGVIYTDAASESAAQVLDMQNRPDKTVHQPDRSESKGTMISQDPVNTKVIGRDDRFVAYDNGTVLDTKTGLMWADRDNGPEISWDDAKKYCENYRGGGYTDWRMPTRDELATLYDAKNVGINGCHVAGGIDTTECTLWNVARMGKTRSSIFMFKYGGRQWRPIPSSKIGRALPVRGTGKYRAEK